MQIEQPSSTGQQANQNSQQVPKALVLNLFPTYTIANQSELKCHFRLRKLYQPRLESIDSFMERALRFWNLESKVAFMQLSNVFKDELVEYSIGFLYDEDAYRIVRDNVVFRLQDKKGIIANYKPIPGEIFQRYLDKNKVVPADKEIFIPPIVETIEKPVEKQQQQVKKPVPTTKGITYFLFVPQGISESDIRLSLRSLSIEAESIRFCSDPSNPYVQLTLSFPFEQTIDINGYPCLVTPSSQNVSKLVSEYQLRVTSNRSTSMLTAYAQLKKHGKVVYIDELASGKWNMIFGSKAVVEKLLKMDSDFRMETIREPDAVQWKNIKISDRFYDRVRGRKDREALRTEHRP